MHSALHCSFFRGQLMRRREFISLLGGTAATWPFLARAEERTPRRRIGNVLVGTPAVVGRLGAALEQRLAEVGYQNGRNIDIVTRIVLPQREIVEHAIAALRPDIDVLVVGGTIGGVAAKKVASDIPTVFHSVGAPVDIGLAAKSSALQVTGKLSGKIRPDQRSFRCSVSGDEVANLLQIRDGGILDDILTYQIVPGRKISSTQPGYKARDSKGKTRVRGPSGG